MDIIIRNGVIDKPEAKRIKDIKNEEGLFKKDYKDYIKGVPGPYYDFFNVHLCIPRRANVIPNFYGPQDPKKLKLLENMNKVSPLSKYCVICHKLIVQKTAYPSKKRILIQEDIFARKPNKIDELENSLKKFKISNESNESNESNKSNESNQINNIENELEYRLQNINITVPLVKWKDLYLKLHDLNIKQCLYNEKNKQNRVIKRFDNLCYKLITKRVLYEVNIFETKLIYPNELTPYQKFKLSNPNYKDTPMFSHQRNHRITENYVTIE